jgi:hypothetical protein
MIPFGHRGCSHAHHKNSALAPRVGGLRPERGVSIIKIGIDTDMPDLKVATSLVGLQPGQEKLECYSGAKQSQEVHPSSRRPSSKTAIYSPRGSGEIVGATPVAAR